MADRDAGGCAIRILGLVEGDDRATMSGVGGYLLDALARRFAVVARLDYSPHGGERLALAAATFRPTRAAWRARFHTSPAAHRSLSRALSQRLRGDLPEFDVALQVHGWVAGQPRPYTLYIDQTRLMAERGWPAWIPLTPRERPSVLERERTMYAGAAHIFTMGEPARESLEVDYGVEPASITVVGGGLNLPSLPAPRQLPAQPSILFVGRDFERKGGDCLLRAFELVRRRVPDAELHIVGVPRRFLGPGVISHGRLADRGSLARLYRSTRVFVMPSRYEPWGLVFPEAMAHGMPCIGSEVQSIPEILGFGEAGVLVMPDDAEGLANALERLLTDDQLAERIGSAGRRRVERCYTWEHVAARIASPLSATVRSFSAIGGG
jgi:glycosyltransferase involved in cell wall biosynthesis